MAVFRVGPLPEGAPEAAAAFHADMLPKVLAELGLNPLPSGEGDHAKHGGGARAGDPNVDASRSSPVPLHQPAAGPPPRAGEDLLLIFAPASYDHRGWRLAAVQDLARAAAPVRINGIVGDDETAIVEVVAWLEQAPGITGQLLALGDG